MSVDDDDIENFGFSAEFFGFDPADEAADDVDADDAAFATSLFTSTLADEPAPAADTPALIATVRSAARPGSAPVDELAVRRRLRRKNWMTGVLVAAAVGAIGVFAVPKLFDGGSDTTSAMPSSAAAAASTSAAGSMAAAPEAASGTDAGSGDAASSSGAAGGAPGAAAGRTQPAPSSSAAAASSAAVTSAPESSAGQSAVAADSTTAASSSPQASAGAQPPAAAPQPTSRSTAGCRWTPLPADAVRAATAALGIPAGTQRAVVAACPDNLVGGVRIPASGAAPGLTITVVTGKPGACLGTGSCTRVSSTDTANPKYSYQGPASGVVVYGDGLEVLVVADGPAGRSVSQDDLAAAGRAVIDALR